MLRSQLYNRFQQDLKYVLGKNIKLCKSNNLRQYSKGNAKSAKHQKEGYVYQISFIVPNFTVPNFAKRIMDIPKNLGKSFDNGVNFTRLLFTDIRNESFGTETVIKSKQIYKKGVMYSIMFGILYNIGSGIIEENEYRKELAKMGISQKTYLAMYMIICGYNVVSNSPYILLNALLWPIILPTGILYVSTLLLLEIACYIPV